MACVYEHIRSDTNTIFYIGIGKKNSRAYSKCSRNTYWKNIVKKCNNIFNINILHDKLSWEDACEKEKQYIIIKSNLINIVLNTNKGLAIDSLSFRKHNFIPIIGTIQVCFYPFSFLP